MTGHVRKTGPGPDRDRLRARFLARHPKAALYADFGDFAFWRLTIESAHLNGGFAKAADYAGDDILTPVAGAEALLAAEADALDHLNQDHAEALGLYAHKLAGEPAARWRATGLDPDGLDLGAGDLTARLVFAERVTEPSALRNALVALAKLARET